MKVVILLILFSISMQPTSVYAAGVVIPMETLLKIEAKAAVDFPNNHSKQEDVIKIQTVAYNKVKNYKNKKVSAKLLEKIKIIAAQDFPHDYKVQLSRINQLVNSYVMLGRLSAHSPAPGIVICKGLRRRLANKGGREYYYWGSLKPGSADVIYLVVSSNLGLIGQNFGFPNPDGTWEITIWGDYNVGNTRKEKFYCEKY